MGRIGKRQPSAIKYDSWFEFGDICREALEAGIDIKILANLFKRKPVTIQRWVGLATLFPPKYRFEEISPSHYESIAKAPDPYKMAQFVHSEYERGYPMHQPDIELTVQEWTKQHPRPPILINYGPIHRLYRWDDKKQIYPYEQAARQLGLPLDFITRICMLYEGKLPDFVNYADERLVSYIIALQQQIEELKKQSLQTNSTDSKINKFLECMEAEPENHDIELKIIRKTGGRPAIDINLKNFIAWHSKGLSDGEIASKMKISRPTVIRRREELGLKPNRTAGQRGPAKRAQGE